MKLFHKIIAAFMVVAFGATVTWAAPVPTNKKHQTKAGKYLSAKEASSFIMKHRANTLFIDVRTPVEIEYVGYSYLMDKNIPLVTTTTRGWDHKKHRYTDIKNPNFVKQVKAALKAKGLNKHSNIVFMCRSGDRSAAAVNKMYKAGYKNVYTVEDGFEGGKDKMNHQRTVNGWKNTAPKNTWGYKLDKRKMVF